MREMEVLGDGHLKLDFADWNEFFETVMAEQERPHSEAAAPTACFKQITAGHWRIIRPASPSSHVPNRFGCSLE
jgi:hypothetical protein